MSLREWLAQHPPPDGAFGQSLAGVAERTLTGVDFMIAVRELLDEFTLLQSDRERRRAIEHVPPPTGDPRHDAFLGALGEHLALLHSLERPRWVLDPDRFLDCFWFVSEVPGFRALALAQAPAAFRRRGVLLPARSLERV